MFLLTVFIFGIGTVAFVNNYEKRIDDYMQDELNRIENMKEVAARNATQLAIDRQNFVTKPRPNSFISEARGKYIPNNFTYSAFAVFGFNIRSGSSNPLLKVFNELNWEFIVTILLSFTAFLLTFDSISGEKESRTLAITLSNNISRGTVLIGKYLASITTMLFMLIPGICISIAIILLSGSIVITPVLLLEIAAFIGTSILFIACITAFGLLSSVMVKQSNVSMLIALVLWIVMVVIVPNSALFWSHSLFPIENSRTLNERINKSRNDINDSYKKNSGDTSFVISSRFPSTPQHKQHVERETKIFNTEMQIRNDHYNEMFNQLEKTRYITFLSPISLFNYMNESIVDGGYFRFQQIWDSLHEYQTQFMQFFREFDANDPESPHWFHPRRDLSSTRKAVDYDAVPVYSERAVSTQERFMFMSLYLMVMVLHTTFAFLAALALFVRYDVR
ncbi:ABC transporter permease [Candidatus Latescibacterota bacterium]